MQAYNLAFFPAPETRHEQDIRPHTGFAQGNCFIQRGYAQPLRPFCLKRL